MPDASDQHSSTRTAATAAVKAAAAEAGFGLCGIANATPPDTLDALHDWLDDGHAGKMEYIERRRNAYGDPASVLPNVQSVVMVALDYRTEDPAPPQEGYGRISRYAWGSADYHDVIRDKLKPVAASLHKHVPGCRTRAVVDTAPLLERDFARRAGLGWFGKNTMLLSKTRGSFFFLGALLTDAELVPDNRHETSHCGTCTACLDACPTDAFPIPYVLDARRCVSYLTIELRDQPVDPEYAHGLEDWLFGCDICQDVCPWNSKAPRSEEESFQPLPDAAQAGLVHLQSLLEMSELEFNERFRGTPLERTGLRKLQSTARLLLQKQSR